MKVLLRNLLTYISRNLHSFYWRLSGNHDEYIRIQASSSHNTRENLTVQENIKFALNEFYFKLPDKNSRILDAGCGDGWTLEQIKLQGYTDLWGVDINEEKLVEAKTKGVTNVSKALLPELNFDDNYFDAVFCRHVYEHLLYPQQTLAAFYRVLKPDGLLFLIAPKSEINAETNESHLVTIKSADDISRVAKACGFRLADTQEHMLEDLEYWVIGKK